jgi:hypothetical protein
MSSSDESDPIIAFKCEARYTNIDYCDNATLIWGVSNSIVVKRYGMNIVMFRVRNIYIKGVGQKGVVSGDRLSDSHKTAIDALIRYFCAD